MNKYINLINDGFVLDFLNAELNSKAKYYKDFLIDRTEYGIDVAFRSGHEDKFSLRLTDFYVLTLKTSHKLLQKNWQIALTKKFGYKYLTDLREELSEVIRKKHIQEISKMQKLLSDIEEKGIKNFCENKNK